MSALCSVVRAHFGEYAGELLTESERGEVRKHLRRCRPCASEAAAFDPTLVFAAAPAESVSEEEIAAILSAVKTGIALENAERRLGARPRNALLRAGDALAASGMLGKPLVRRSSATPPRGFLALPLSLRPRRARDRHFSDGLLGAPKRRRAGAAAAAAAAAVLTLLLPGASRREAKPPAKAAAIPQPQTAGPQDHLPAARPSDSGTFPAKATIYDWSPGAGEGEPRVVWIVDRSLDI